MYSITRVPTYSACTVPTNHQVTVGLVKKPRVLTSNPPFYGRTGLYNGLYAKSQASDRKSRTLVDVAWFQGGSAFAAKA